MRSMINSFLCFFIEKLVEYTECTSAMGVRLLSNECPLYDTKQSDGEVLVMLDLWENAEYPFISIAPTFTQARSGGN